MGLHYRLDPGYWADVFRASDPGLDRLRMAGRAVLTVLLALAALYFVAGWLGHPLATGLPGIMAGMLGAILVQDKTPRAQKITLALLAIPAVGVFMLGSALAGNPLLNGVGFVAVILASVIARRFGPRGMALGMVGFLSYIFALFFHAKLADLPWIFVSTAVSLGCAFLVRFVLIGAGGRLRFRWARRAMLARINVVLRLLESATGEDGAGKTRWKKMRPRLIQQLELLNGAALLVGEAAQACREPAPGDDDDSDGDDSDDSDDSDDDIAPRWVFAAEMATERVVVIVRRILTRDDDPVRAHSAIIAALDQTRAAVQAARRQRPAPPVPALEELATAAHTQGNKSLRRLAMALGDLKQAAFLDPDAYDAARIEPLGPLDPPEDAEHADSPDKDAQPEAKKGLHPNTREAVQAVLAGALAIVAGHLISPTRWYWAVIASFVIFIRTGTRGHILLKGWQRVLGTIFGVAAGMGIAILVEGHRSLELGLIFVAIFLGYYLIQISYAWMIACVTTEIAILYSLMGRPVRELLQVRLEETLLGVVIGVAVATLVLPTRTRPEILSRMAELLEECADFFVAAGARIGASRGEVHLKQHVRKLTRSLQTLRDAARPMRGRIVLVRTSHTKYQLMLLGALVYYARNLAASAEPDDANQTDRTLDDAPLDNKTRAAISRAAAQLAENCRSLAVAVKDPDADVIIRSSADRLWVEDFDADRDVGAPDSGPLKTKTPTPGRPLADGNTAIFSLRTADQIVREFAREIDGASVSPTGLDTVLMDAGASKASGRV